MVGSTVAILLQHRQMSHTKNNRGRRSNEIIYWHLPPLEMFEKSYER
jgi:hypothetical protein